MKEVPNARVLARIECPRCGRPDVSVRTNFTIYEHQGFDGSCLPCLGMPPEIVFTVLLRLAGLDIRPDSDAPTLPVDRSWQRRQAKSDAEASAYYAQFDDRRAEA